MAESSFHERTIIESTIARREEAQPLAGQGVLASREPALVAVNRPLQDKLRGGMESGHPTVAEGDSSDRGRRFVAIETKVSPRSGNEELRGLRAVADLPGLERRILVHLGRSVRRSEDGIDVLPFAEFARQVAAGKI